MIYLDNAASTPVDKRIVSEMMPYLTEQYGNPSSIHRYGRLASKAVHKARKNIAGLINAEPSEILLTSGGTESNNTALYGIVKSLDGRHVITSQIEHDAILEPCRKLEKQGVEVTYLSVDEFGLIDPAELRSKITDDTCLASIMFANNEVGTVQPIKELAQICHQNNVIFHTDAVQAVGKIPVDVRDLDVDLLSISSHKINGPKGVGAMFIRNGISVDSMILGGGQENGLRSGTENVAGIVGFGKACSLCNENLSCNTQHYQKMQQKLVAAVTSELTHTTFNGHQTKRIPNNIHLTFLGINGEDLIIKLDEYGIAASTGSACSVNTQKASHVLQAMGFSHEQTSGSLRLTLGIHNTEEEIDDAIQVIIKAVNELRQFSAFKEKYDF